MLNVLMVHLVVTASLLGLFAVVVLAQAAAAGVRSLRRTQPAPVRTTPSVLIPSPSPEPQGAVAAV